MLWGLHGLAATHARTPTTFMAGRYPRVHGPVNLQVNGSLRSLSIWHPFEAISGHGDVPQTLVLGPRAFSGRSSDSAGLDDIVPLV